MAKLTNGADTSSVEARAPCTEKEAKGFDLLYDLFWAQAVKPPQLETVNFRALSPFQRALLVIDGTVTKFIEAYTMEPIEVVRLAQETCRLPSENVWLEAPEDTAVVVREVLLRGRYSDTIYAYAASLVVPDRLSVVEKQGLEVDGEGLGRILLASRTETYRDVLWYGKERDGNLPPALQHLIGDEFISRTYRIVAGSKPIMLINEKFPSNMDRIPSLY